MSRRQANPPLPRPADSCAAAAAAPATAGPTGDSCRCSTCVLRPRSRHCHVFHVNPTLACFCRYSPNLSRRCTHLALPSGEAGAPPTAPSEKLLSGLRNRSKWGLHIVDLRWLLDSARAEGRLDEARFPARLPPGAAAAASHGQEQAPPGSAAAPRPAPSGSKASVMSGGMSLQAADTYQRGSPFCVATMAAAAARAQRPTDPLRNSVTSRPLSSFRQPGTSLQTQSPSVKRSVRWAHPAGTPEGSTAGVAAPSGAVAAAHAAAAAGMLPGEVEQAALRNEDEGEHRSNRFSGQALSCRTAVGCLAGWVVAAGLPVQPSTTPFLWLFCRPRHQFCAAAHDASRLPAC